jgi:hypothetical protein
MTPAIRALADDAVGSSRLSLLTVAAIEATVVWSIVAHGLWGSRQGRAGVNRQRSAPRRPASTGDAVEQITQKEMSHLNGARCLAALLGYATPLSQAPVTGPAWADGEAVRLGERRRLDAARGVRGRALLRG